MRLGRADKGRKAVLRRKEQKISGNQKRGGKASGRDKAGNLR